MKQSLGISIIGILCSGTFLAAQNPDVVTKPLYEVRLTGQNTLGKSYGRALEKRSGLREIIVGGKTMLRSYRFESVLPGKNIPSSEKASTAFQNDGKNVQIEKTLVDINTGKDFAKIETKMEFGDSRINVSHTMIPLVDFTLKPHGQPEDMLVFPIETVQNATVEVWDANGRKLTGLIPSLSQKENWSLDGIYRKVLLRTDEGTLTFTAGEKTIIHFVYFHNLARNTLWRNPVLRIKRKIGIYTEKELLNQKKGEPFFWGYSIEVEKNK